MKFVAMINDKFETYFGMTCRRRSVELQRDKHRVGP